MRRIGGCQSQWPNGLALNERYLQRLGAKDVNVYKTVWFPSVRMGSQSQKEYHSPYNPTLVPILYPTTQYNTVIKKFHCQENAGRARGFTGPRWIL